MLTRRSFVKVLGAVAWCVAFLRPFPAVSEVLDHDEVLKQEGTLYMSQDASRGIVLRKGYDRADMAERTSKRWSVTRDKPHWNTRQRFARAKEAYVVRVNQPLDMRTLVGLAARRNR